MKPDIEALRVSLEEMYEKVMSKSRGKRSSA